MGSPFLAERCNQLHWRGITLWFATKQLNSSTWAPKMTCDPFTQNLRLPRRVVFLSSVCSNVLPRDSCYSRRRLTQKRANCFRAEPKIWFLSTWRRCKSLAMDSYTLPKNERLEPEDHPEMKRKLFQTSGSMLVLGGGVAWHKFRMCANKISGWLIFVMA